MRIAQVSPLHESVPPQRYGGTERVVSYLTEELVRRGFEVTLFASGDSVTRARLVPVCKRSLRADRCLDKTAYEVLLLELLFRRAHQFDLIHFHSNLIHFPLARRVAVECLTTLHGRLDLPELKPLFREFSEAPLVSISDAQRLPLPWVNWLGTVYHGLPEHLYPLNLTPGDHLAFLGRISEEKRPDRAIEIARRAGMRLKIAAKVDPADRAYFERIRPLLDSPHVEFLGEIGEEKKAALLGGARALLFPIEWPEPFGLVVIEALACGTPVIAYPRGSVTELIEHGTTGFLVADLDQAVEACFRVGELDRGRCRREFERRFSVSRMVRDYLRLYSRLLGLRQELPAVQEEWP